MNKIALFATLAASANADVLLNVDLSVADQVTITATDAASSATVSGNNLTGVYLWDIYTSLSSGAIQDTLVSGDLVANGDVSNNSPRLFTADSGSFGLNIYSWTSDNPSNFVTDQTAFIGSATWILASDDYAQLVAGNSFGDIYAFADTDENFLDTTVIGQWNVIPTPSSAALLGLGGLMVARRRR